MGHIIAGVQFDEKWEKNRSRLVKSGKKAALKNYVEQNIPIGLLCYNGSEPIAWCSVAPRETYEPLSGDDAIKNVWSIACFFIIKEFRHLGITENLIEEALKYAKANGAQYVEAYPVDHDSPSYHFMGYKSTFEKIGFQFKHKAGKRRNVMTQKVK